MNGRPIICSRESNKLVPTQRDRPVKFAARSPTSARAHAFLSHAFTPATINHLQVTKTAIHVLCALSSLPPDRPRRCAPQPPLPQPHIRMRGYRSKERSEPANVAERAPIHLLMRPPMMDPRDKHAAAEPPEHHANIAVSK